jgi:hypothetical protein
LLSNFAFKFNLRRYTEALIASSGKLAALDEMLPRLRAGGHKVGRCRLTL